MKFIKLIKSNKLPDILKEYQVKLADEFYQADIKLQKELEEERNRLKYDFYKDERYNKRFIVTLLESNYETLRKINDKRADEFIQNLWDKVNSKINNIEKIDLHISGRDLNGIIYGDNCNIKLETILAGGPIQRLHNRCLIKVLKKEV